MWLCYLLVQNVGWAIIIFTVLIKTALFPLNLKQQKSMAISQLYTPRVQEIQRKYKNNPEKQQEELTKLQKEGYNPTGGCGTMLLSMLVLFGIIGVVYKPMTHMERFTSTEIAAIMETAEQIDLAQAILASPEDAAVVAAFRNDPTALTFVEGKDENDKKINNRITFEEGFNYEEAKAATVVTAEDLATYGVFTDDEIKTLIGKNRNQSSRLSAEVKNAITVITTNYNPQGYYGELRALKSFENENHRALFALNENISEELLTKMETLLKNMYFGPISLIDTPTWSFNVLLLIPALSFIFSLAQLFIQQAIQKKQNPQMAAAQPASAKMMLYIMPFFSLWISFTVPAGAGFYWALSYLTGIVQTLVTAKFWPADKIRAEAKAKMEAAAAQKEQRAKIVTVDADGKETEKVQRLSELSKKEIDELNRKKLEAARKADAEKYGEEYVELPDDEY
ncbi:MAG: membrane protein insertase YidC [Ruminiclostridium sp.]|nr:membrane protein insertase YidC [Ruminiclostridium sp.]